MDMVHNQDACRFEYNLDGALAVCEYRIDGDVWDFFHTHVPGSMRGKGVANMLVEAALKHVLSLKGKIRPTCSYVAAYIASHPEYRNHIA
jgi:uncharacterized protein